MKEKCTSRNNIIHAKGLANGSPGTDAKSVHRWEKAVRVTWDGDTHTA